MRMGPKGSQSAIGRCGLMGVGEIENGGSSLTPVNIGPSLEIHPVEAFAKLHFAENGVLQKPPFTKNLDLFIPFAGF